MNRKLAILLHMSMARLVDPLSPGATMIFNLRWTAWMGGMLALFITSVGWTKTLETTTAAGVVAAGCRAQAGDEIVLADGEYPNLALTLAAKGQVGKPMRLRARNAGHAVLTGSPRLEITGNFIEVQGIAFRGCALRTGTRGAVVFDGSGNSRLAGCTFEDSSLPHGAALVSFRNGAHDNQVVSNRFLATRYKALMVVVDDRSLKQGCPIRNRVEHNLFQNVPPYHQNGAETIQIGQRAAPHSEQRTETVVEENEFVHCDGEAEIISVKTSGNIIRNNVFRENKGEVVIRHGHGNTVTGNRFEGGTGGIRVSGHGHTVTGNTINGCRGTGIRLFYGTPDLTHPASYLPVYDCVISGNTITDCGTMGILVGDHKNAHLVDPKWAGSPWFSNAVQDCTVAPYSNRILSNTITGKAGCLLKSDDAPKNIIESNTLNERQR
jgi:poly(beta-D-mannuronate) lyase